MTESGTRKLAAVMFTDITGYTSMVQKDEADALDKVNSHREILHEYTALFNGEIISFYGDGSLSTYGSAIDAVNCAIRIQEVYRKANVPVRIGIHLGDIVYKQDSVFGDGVNVASRIQSQGVSGSILISSKMQQEIENHKEINTKLLGRYRLKNVKRALKIYAVTGHGLTVPPRKKLKVHPLVVAAFLLLAGYLAVNHFVIDGRKAQLEERKEERVAVRFQDFANISDRQRLSDMATHWIINRLGEVPDADVVSYSDALNEPNTPIAAASFNQRTDFAQKTKAVNVLEGGIYTFGEDLLFKAALINLETGESIVTFEDVVSNTEDPMQGISQLADQVLGWWASRNDNTQSVPNYTAYRRYLNARSNWKVDNDIARSELIASIEADSTFIDPHFLLTELFLDLEDYQSRDSIIEVIRKRFNAFTPRQRALYNGYQSAAEGNLLETYRHFMVEINTDPYDLFVNTGAMVQAVSVINDPREALRFYDMIPIDSLDLFNCVYCQTRPRIATYAYLAIGELDSASIAASHIPPTTSRNRRAKLLPLIYRGDRAGIDNAIRLMLSQGYIDQRTEMHGDIAWNLLVAGFDSLAMEYCREVVNSGVDGSLAMECNYLLGNYDFAIDFIEKEWLPDYADNMYVLNWAARAYARKGDPGDIDRIRELIDTVADKDQYKYGKYIYLKGIISAIQGNDDQALRELQRAYYQGYSLSSFSYQYDVDLQHLVDDPGFLAIINPEVN